MIYGISQLEGKKNLPGSRHFGSVLYEIILQWASGNQNKVSAKMDLEGAICTHIILYRIAGNSWNSGEFFMRSKDMLDKYPKYTIQFQCLTALYWSLCTPFRLGVERVEWSELSNRCNFF